MVSGVTALYGRSGSGKTTVGLTLMRLHQASAGRAGVVFTALTRFVRQAIQILLLALGAWLVISQEASAGIMIATTVLLGRAIQPVEQLVGSWRALADGRAAGIVTRDLVTGEIRSHAGHAVLNGLVRVVRMQHALHDDGDVAP